MNGPPSSPPLSRAGLLPAFAPASSPQPAREFLRPKFAIYQDPVPEPTFLPTPIPTSEANAPASSSPPASPARDAFRPAPATPAAAAAPARPLQALVVMRVPLSGAAVTLGRSSKSSTFALRARNKLASRVHARLAVVDGFVVIECLGWNGLTVSVPQETGGRRDYEVARGEILNVERMDGITIDVHGDKALVDFSSDAEETEEELWKHADDLAAPPPLPQMPALPAPAHNEPDALRLAREDLENTLPAKRRRISVDNIANEPRMAASLKDFASVSPGTAAPPMRPASPASEDAPAHEPITSASASASQGAPAPALEPPVPEPAASEPAVSKPSATEPAESKPGAVSEPAVPSLDSEPAAPAPAPEHAAPSPAAPAPTPFQKPTLGAPLEVPAGLELEVSSAAARSQPALDAASETPAVKEQTPEPSLPDATSAAQTPMSAGGDRRRRKYQDLSVELRAELENVAVNIIAFSRLSAVPLAAVRKASTQLEVLPKAQVREIIRAIKCIGVTDAQRDDSGRLPEDEYYYIPELDADESRRTIVQTTRGHRSLRSCRKTRKQYFYRPLNLGE